MPSAILPEIWNMVIVQCGRIGVLSHGTGAIVENMSYCQIAVWLTYKLSFVVVSLIYFCGILNQ